MSIFKRNTTVVRSASAAPSKSDDRKSSEFWINLGYSVEYTDEDGKQQKAFVPLNRGIPMDDIEALDESRTGYIGYLNQASNALLKDLRELCEELNPGETRIIAGSSDTLEIQIRRVRDKTQVADASSNPFLRTAA